MILTCPECRTRYQADATKFPPAGRDVRCARCGCLWHQLPPEPEYAREPAYAEVAGTSEVSRAWEASAPAQQDSYIHPQDSFGHTEEFSQHDAYAPVQHEAYAPHDSYAQVESYAPKHDDYVAPQPAPRPPQRAVARPSGGGGFLRKMALSTGWLGLVALLGVIVVGFTIYQQKIVRAWPQSATLYSKIGLKVNATGLQFNDVRYCEENQDGQTVMTVTGRLVNITDRELRVPQIRVGLSDAKKRELYHWTFTPDVLTLLPGQSTRFVTRLASPPPAARQLDVRLARSGE